MTTLAIWQSVGASRRTIYFASDSRISWADGSRWDSGRKIYFCRKHAVLFGFAGKALGISMSLSRMTDLLDSYESGALELSLVVEMCTEFFNQTLQAFSAQDFSGSEIYIARGGLNCDAIVGRWKYSLSDRVWMWCEIESRPNGSEMICVAGTGSSALREQLRVNKSDAQSGTARFVFWNVVDFIRSENDVLTGGRIQIAKMIIGETPNPIGLVFEGEASVLGIVVKSPSLFPSIDWRNANFELLNPVTGERFSGQPRQVKGKVDYSA